MMSPSPDAPTLRGATTLGRPQASLLLPVERVLLG